MRRVAAGRYHIRELKYVPAAVITLAKQLLRRFPMLPARFAPVLFAAIMSGLMSCIVTCIATLRAAGTGPGMMEKWMDAWSLSWPTAFAVILVLSPLVRRLMTVLVRPAE
ncbi:DUF2798 domain-containing protein [Roseobacteraceae bacterium NS-SX3]